MNETIRAARAALRWASRAAKKEHELIAINESLATAKDLLREGIEEGIKFYEWRDRVREYLEREES